MKNAIITGVYVFAGLLSVSYALIAKGGTVAQGVSWTSKNSADVITINNGNGANLSITINVDKNPAMVIPGISVSHCGSTSHIDAGSSAVCVTKDASNPVSFSSDSPSIPATGTYSVKLD